MKQYNNNSNNNISYLYIQYTQRLFVGLIQPLTGTKRGYH